MTSSATLHVMNNMQSEIIYKTRSHYIYAAMFDELEIPHKFFQNWIVLRMLGIRDCVPLILCIESTGHVHESVFRQLRLHCITS